MEAARAESYAYGLSVLDDAEFDLAARSLAPVAAICPVDRTGRQAMLLLAAAELDPRNASGRPDAAAELAAFQLARPDEEDGTIAALARELYVLALDYGATAIEADDVPGPEVVWTHYLAGDAEEAADAARADAQARDAVGEPDDAPAAVDADAIGPPVGVQVAARRDGGPLCEVPSARTRLVMPELTRTPVVARTRPGAAAPAQPRAGGEDVRALMAEVTRLEAELASKEQELDRIRRTLRP